MSRTQRPSPCVGLPRCRRIADLDDDSRGVSRDPSTSSNRTFDGCERLRGLPNDGRLAASVRPSAARKDDCQLQRRVSSSTLPDRQDTTASLTSPRGTSSTKRVHDPAIRQDRETRPLRAHPRSELQATNSPIPLLRRISPLLSARSRPPAEPSRFEHTPKQPQPRAARRLHLARHNLPKQPRAEQQLPRRATARLYPLNR
jgi:hypothetical protein